MYCFSESSSLPRRSCCRCPPDQSRDQPTTAYHLRSTAQHDLPLSHTRTPHPHTHTPLTPTTPTPHHPPHPPPHTHAHTHTHTHTHICCQNQRKTQKIAF